tara:strand:- start:736 stop:1104 length:369 start_codon:yes stop_codon:yes gene_type:complete
MISGPAYGAVDERWEQLEMDIEAINEMFEGLGPVTVKRMFGGQGVYHQGRIIALEVDGEMLLKADKLSAGKFEAAGSTQWAHAGKNRPVKMPYWSIPDSAMDDPDEMKTWVHLAFEASLRAK